MSAEKFDLYLRCACGTHAHEEKYLGEFTDKGYCCAECLMKANQEAVKAYQEKRR